MVDPEKLSRWSAVALRHKRAFLLGAFLGASLVFGLYKGFILPGVDDKLQVATQRVAFFNEQIGALKSASYSASASVGTRLSEVRCAWATATQGAFSAKSGDYKTAGWIPDAVDAVNVLSDTNLLGTHYASIVSDKVLSGVNRPVRYEKDIGGQVRNPQFPRIELPAPVDWFGREVKMRAAMRWADVRLVPNGYPGVVAVNIVYRDGALPSTDQFIVLHGEHTPRQDWTPYTFPTFRLPPGTTTAKVRIGLHGVFGALDIKDVEFEVCR